MQACGPPQAAELATRQVWFGLAVVLDLVWFGFGFGFGFGLDLDLVWIWFGLVLDLVWFDVVWFDWVWFLLFFFLVWIWFGLVWSGLTGFGFRRVRLFERNLSGPAFCQSALNSGLV